MKKLIFLTLLLNFSTYGAIVQTDSLCGELKIGSDFSDHGGYSLYIAGETKAQNLVFVKSLESVNYETFEADIIKTKDKRFNGLKEGQKICISGEYDDLVYGAIVPESVEVKK